MNLQWWRHRSVATTAANAAQSSIADRNWMSFWAERKSRIYAGIHRNRKPKFQRLL